MDQALLKPGLRLTWMKWNGLNRFCLVKGLLYYVTLATKLFEVVLLHKDITQLEQKNSSPWYTCDQSLHRVSAISVHYFLRYEHFTERHFHFSWSDFVAWSRNLWTTQMPCNNDNYSEYMVHGTQNDRLEPSVSTQKSVLKNIHRVLRYWQKCIWVVQRFLLQATKSDHQSSHTRGDHH